MRYPPKQKRVRRNWESILLNKIFADFRDIEFIKEKKTYCLFVGGKSIEVDSKNAQNLIKYLKVLKVSDPRLIKVSLSKVNVSFIDANKMGIASSSSLRCSTYSLPRGVSKK